LDCTNANDVTQAGGAEQSSVAHATEEGCIWQLGALIGVLDGRLADSNGDDIAHDHYQGHFRGPGEGGGSDGQKRGEHANPEETPHLQVLRHDYPDLVKVIHPFLRPLPGLNA